VSDFTVEGDGQVRWQGIVVHDYVPSDYLRPKRTEPDCDHCGEVRRSPVHGSPDPLSGWMGRSR
jgi:hypothetical protein